MESGKEGEEEGWGGEAVAPTLKTSIGKETRRGKKDGGGGEKGDRREEMVGSR